MNDVPIEDALDCGRNKKPSKRRDASPDLSTHLHAELQKRGFAAFTTPEVGCGA